MIYIYILIQWSAERRRIFQAQQARLAIKEKTLIFDVIQSFVNLMISEDKEQVVEEKKVEPLFDEFATSEDIARVQCSISPPPLFPRVPEVVLRDSQLSIDRVIRFHKKYLFHPLYDPNSQEVEQGPSLAKNSRSLTPNPSSELQWKKSQDEQILRRAFEAILNVRLDRDRLHREIWTLQSHINVLKHEMETNLTRERSDMKIVTDLVAALKKKVTISFIMKKSSSMTNFFVAFSSCKFNFFFFSWN